MSWCNEIASIVGSINKMGTRSNGYIVGSKAINGARSFDHRNTQRSVLALCIASSRDGQTTLAMARALPDYIAGASYFELESTGLLPCIEPPQRYAEELADFAGAIKGLSA